MVMSLVCGPPDQADENEKNERAHGGADNRGDEPAVGDHLHVDEWPAAHIGAQDADEQVADQSERRASDRDAGEQAGRNADRQEDEVRFTEQGAAPPGRPGATPRP
jgi:hypothetical protein